MRIGSTYHVRLGLSVVSLAVPGLEVGGQSILELVGDGSHFDYNFLV